uniref:Uncharacterized protein n=1 Tax=Glossina morsitans morsitans TaxID=37546 RepID=A0A1B0G101_GLOMM
MVFIPDEIFSELLQSYPELWSLEQGVGRVNWTVLGRSLADKLSERTGRLITVRDVRTKCINLRKSLRRLDTSPGRAYSNLLPYAWYARKLGLTNAVDRMTAQMLSHGEAPVVVDCGEVQMDTDCVDFVGFDKKQTEKQTEDRPFTTESPDISSKYYSYNVSRDIDDVYDEGPTTSGEAAQRRKARRLEPVVNPDEEADIRVHQIIGAQPIPNIQTEECITENLLENTIKREEPELEIFPSCSNSSGSENDSAPRSQSASMRFVQNEPASPIFSKETETEDYRKQILNELKKCNEQIHNEIARKKDVGRRKLQLEEEKIILLREYVNSVKDIKTIFENYLNKN